jgi:5'-nucleotidase
MRILVTNDDGVYSPGLSLLAEVASQFGEVRIVAPDLEQSSMAQAVTSSRPLSHRRAQIGAFEAFQVNGTPADCVALGLFLLGTVDLVFSGLNMGLNVGNSTWHSGTLAAARQASLLGVRGVAFSGPDFGEDVAVDAFRPHLDKVVSHVMELPHMRLLNVNFPRNPRGIRFTRQSVRQYDGAIEPSRDPHGREIFWFVPRPLGPAEAGTDRWAVEHDFVSITPLRLDLTDPSALERLIV